MMAKQSEKLFRFFIASSLAISLVGSQRWQEDVATRGDSFGLENFLFRTIDNSETNDSTENANCTESCEKIEISNVSGPKESQSKSRNRKISGILENRAKFGHVRAIDEGTQLISSGHERVTNRMRTRVIAKRIRRPLKAAETEANKNGTDTGRISQFQWSRTTPETKSHNGQIESAYRPSSNFKGIAKTEVAKESGKATESEVGKNSVTERTWASDLKAFLKQQTETLSLSELLQKRNLSLSDLLGGNKNASAILKSNPPSFARDPPNPDPESDVNDSGTESKLPKGNFEPIIREITRKTTRVNALKPNLKRNRSKNARDESVEPASAIVKYRENSGTDKGTTKSTKTNSNRSSYDPKSRIEELRAKLRNFQGRKKPAVKENNKSTEVDGKIEKVFAGRETASENTVREIKNDTIEISTVYAIEIGTKADAEDELPTEIDETEMLSDSEKVIEPERPAMERENATDRSETAENSKMENEFSSSTTKGFDDAEKSEEVDRLRDAKDDLIELLKSDELAGILLSRNMTPQEVLENRGKWNVRSNIEELFFGRFSTEAAANVRPTRFPPKTSNDSETDSEKVAEDSSNAIHQTREPKSFDLENSAEPVFPNDCGNPPDPEIPDTPTENPKVREGGNGNAIGLDSIDSATSRERRKTEEVIEVSFVPPAVKSAILASGIVTGMALFVFVAIFAACGIRQRRSLFKGRSPSASSSSSFSSSLEKGFGGVRINGSKRGRRILPYDFEKSSRKTIGFHRGEVEEKEEEEGETGSGTSFGTGSYIWTTLKNTFRTRSITLDHRFEGESKIGEIKSDSKRRENGKKLEIRRPEAETIDFEPEQQRTRFNKINRSRNFIGTISGFKIHSGRRSINYFDDSGLVF